jgi:hypothetical protein
MDNVLSSIIAKNFPSLKKGREIQDRRLSDNQTCRIRTETFPDIIRTLNMKNIFIHMNEYRMQGKRSPKSHIKANSS